MTPTRLTSSAALVGNYLGQCQYWLTAGLLSVSGNWAIEALRQARIAAAPYKVEAFWSYHYGQWRVGDEWLSEDECRRRGLI